MTSDQTRLNDAYREADAAKTSLANYLSGTFGASTLAWLAYLGARSKEMNECERMVALVVLTLLFAGIGCCIRQLILIKRRTWFVFAGIRDGISESEEGERAIVQHAARMRGSSEHWVMFALILLTAAATVALASVAFALLLKERG